MPRLIVRNRSGEVFTVEAQNGLSIMENIRDLDASVDAICGGLCACATCHVFIAAAEQAERLHPRTGEESSMLESSPHFDPARSRLSCQIITSDALDGLELEVAPSDF
jgi:2Fe-2S ferredoxin